MSIYNYDREDTYRGRNPQVRVINYVSCELDNDDRLRHLQWVKNNIPPTSKDFPDPHITLMYSETTPKKFPITDLEGDLIEDIDPKYYITVFPNNFTKYGIFTDLHKTRHLVLYLDSTRVYQQHQYYLKGGATWNTDRLGEYTPMIIIESHTVHNEHSLQELNLPFPDVKYTFKLFHYLRFGESI